MSDLVAQERAQLGLKHIQDAVVDLLSRHAEGMSEADVTERLGLGEGLSRSNRHMLATAVLTLLLESGRVLWDPDAGVYRDNPEKI